MKEKVCELRREKKEKEKRLGATNCINSAYIFTIKLATLELLMH